MHATPQVTFKEADAAKKACEDATPVINGRRANCNLASLGAKPRPQPPHILRPGPSPPATPAPHAHALPSPHQPTPGTDLPRENYVNCVLLVPDKRKGSHVSGANSLAFQPSRWDPGVCRRCHGTTTPPRRPLRRRRRPRTTPTARTSSTTACSHSTPPPPPTGKYCTRAPSSKFQIPARDNNVSLASKGGKKSHVVYVRSGVRAPRAPPTICTARPARRYEDFVSSHPRAACFCGPCGRGGAGTGAVGARTHAWQRLWFGAASTRRDRRGHWRRHSRAQAGPGPDRAASSCSHVPTSRPARRQKKRGDFFLCYWALAMW